MREIWEIKDIPEFLNALSQYIDEKCQYGDKMSVLSQPERLFFIVQSFEMELNNGGFRQFLFNSSGDFSNELVDLFQKIDAKKTAQICQRAINVLKKAIPIDRDERVKMLNECENEDIVDFWDECDNVFYEYQEERQFLTYKYIISNRMFFQ